MFKSQYTGAYNRGIIRTAYHFARPDVSTGAVHAPYFAANGGMYSSPKWSYTIALFPSQAADPAMG